MNRTLAVFLALGLYLTVKGYHSRDGDQAYRLPLLLHRQDPSLFAADPFVKALDAFNPHGGYLALLDVSSRPFGLSVALFVLFAATFAVTCLAIERMARAVWPERGAGVGVIAVLMLLSAKAGNIGTNHLFEAMLLDRLVALALGWTAFASMIANPQRGKWTAAAAIGAAALVHPSLGLQLGMLAGSGWAAWAVARRSGVSFRTAIAAMALLGLALFPTIVMMSGKGSRLFEGLSEGDFLRISALIQGPQHMLPHLWRMPQWLAWACYPALAVLSLRSKGKNVFEGPRGRLTILLMLSLVGLGLAWVAIEGLNNRFATTFQPFRMATVARGLCLVLVAGRVQSLWNRGDATGQLRALLILVGLTGDWAMVVVTLVEFSAEAASHFGRRFEGTAAMVSLMAGLAFLARNDTESGHVRLLAVGAISFAIYGLRQFPREWIWNRRRIIAATAIAWFLPLVAMTAPILGSRRTADRFLANWRFGEYPADDVERLALWCRENTPAHARYVTPPGPKTFRLWSRREVAFNRAASPYHAAGLADWLGRFQDHVGFHGSVDDFANAYLRDRLGLERRYQEMSDADRADLARRQGAGYVIAAPPTSSQGRSPLTLLHVEGRYAVYQVRDDVLVGEITQEPVRTRPSPRPPARDNPGRTRGSRS